RDKLVTGVQTCALPIYERFPGPSVGEALVWVQRQTAADGGVDALPQSPRHVPGIHGELARRDQLLRKRLAGCSQAGLPPHAVKRSEERRVGKECEGGWV